MATNLSNEVKIVNGLATNTDICRLFNLTDKTVRKKLASLSTAMKKGSAVYYRLDQALPLLVKPANVGDYIRSMSFEELPKDLTKEYWAGQRSKQIFLKEAGALWPTNEVVDKVGDAFKTVAMKIRLIPDQVARAKSLSAEQRTEVEGIIDETLGSIAVELKAKFKRIEDVKLPAEIVDPDADDEAEIEIDDDEEL